MSFSKNKISGLARSTGDCLQSRSEEEKRWILVKNFPLDITWSGALNRRVFCRNVVMCKATERALARTKGTPREIHRE